MIRSDARKRNAPTGLPGYFLAPDAYDQPVIWRENGDLPMPVLSKHDLRDDPKLWAAVVLLVEGEAAR